MKTNLFSSLCLIAGAFLLGLGIDYGSFFSIIPGLTMVTIGIIGFKASSTDSK